MRRLIAILFAFCFIPGCSHYLVGKEIPPKYCYPLKGDISRHYIEYDNSICSYTFTINDQSQEITFDGSIEFIRNKLPTPEEPVLG